MFRAYIRKWGRALFARGFLVWQIVLLLSTWELHVLLRHQTCIRTSLRPSTQQADSAQPPCHPALYPPLPSPAQLQLPVPKALRTVSSQKPTCRPSQSDTTRVLLLRIDLRANPRLRIPDEEVREENCLRKSERHFFGRKISSASTAAQYSFYCRRTAIIPANTTDV